MKYYSLIFCLTLFFSPVSFASNTDSTLIRAMDSAGFSPDQVVQVQRMITTAQQQGLPADAVSRKVYEGIAKHVDPGRIVKALERVTSRYEYGYTLARKLTKREKQAVKLGNTMTSGIAAGLTRQDAEKLVNSLQARSKKMDHNELYSLAEETMLTARDLSRQGVSSKTTADVVGKAVQKGYAAREMHTLRNRFNRQGAHGHRESLAKGYGTAIDRGVKAHDLGAHGAGGKGFGGRHGSGGSGGSGGSDGSGEGSSGGSGGSGGSDGSGGGSSGGSSGSGGSDGSGGGSSGGSGGSGGSDDSGAGSSGGSGGSDSRGGGNSSGSGNSGR